MSFSSLSLLCYVVRYIYSLLKTGDLAHNGVLSRRGKCGFETLPGVRENLPFERYHYLLFHALLEVFVKVAKRALCGALVVKVTVSVASSYCYGFIIIHWCGMR